VSAAEPAALPSDLELRELRVEDADAIASLIGACDQTYLQWAPSGWTTPPESEAREKWTRRLAEPERWTLGAVDAKGRLVAMVAARQATAGEGREVLLGRGLLEALFVDPPRWGQRIGIGLLERAESAMQGLGFDVAVLSTPEAAPARAFYEKAGWSSNGVREYLESFDMWMVEYEKQLRPAALP
jgi:GNAT superfamily N-acetyltransferase